MVDKPIPDGVKKIMKDIASSAPAEIGTKMPETLPEIHLAHQFGTRTVDFELQQESAGTIACLALLSPIVNALGSGSTLCVDELDASLHPLLSVELIKLFNSPASNPKGAQLIFNTHDTNLLGSGLLRRDQIWLTGKNDDGSSVLYPLSDFKPRKEENLENGYLQGRYGAIPFLNSDTFVASLGLDDE
jgi:hypothetical protein